MSAFTERERGEHRRQGHREDDGPEQREDDGEGHRPEELPFGPFEREDGEVHLFLGLRAVAEARLAEVERAKREFLAERDQLEAVDEGALRRRVREGDVTVIDVRPREEYEAAHIPGAVSIPLPELVRDLAQLPKKGEIVAYCRGPYCVLAVEAVRLLRRKGFRAVRLEDGVLDWTAHGFRLEASSAK